MAREKSYRTRDVPRPTLTVRVKTFEVPPIRDGLILGREAPVGCNAIRKALNLLVHSPYEHIEPDDDVISDVLVRKSILRRLPKERFMEFIMERIKPMMEPDEILHLDIEAEILLEEEL